MGRFGDHALFQSELVPHVLLPPVYVLKPLLMNHPDANDDWAGYVSTGMEMVGARGGG
jgi:hypothetical protein